jgi:chemotaxis protein MotB
MNQTLPQQQGFISLTLIVLLTIGLSTSAYFLYINHHQQASLESQLDKMQRKLRTTERTLKKTQTSFDEQESQLLRLNNQRRRLNDEIVGVKQALDQVQQDKSNTQTQLENKLQLTQKTLEENLTQQEVEYRNQLSQLNNHSSTLQQKYLSTKEQLDSELSRIASYNSTIETLEERLKREQEALEKLNIDLKILDQKNADLYSEKELLDKKNAELHSEKSRLVKQFEDGTTIIRLENTILFPSGTAELNARGMETLDAVAKTLASFPKHLISIEGHTDHRPIISILAKKYPSNWELSSARAAYAIRYLTQKGLSPHQFQAVGFGSTRPIRKEGDQQQNRRIEILLYPPLEQLTIKPLVQPMKNTVSFQR